MTTAHSNSKHLKALIELAREQAASAAASVEIQRKTSDTLELLRGQGVEQTHALEKVCDKLERMDHARPEAVAEVKAHATTERKLADRATHLWASIITALIGVIGALLAWSLSHQH